MKIALIIFLLLFTLSVQGQNYISYESPVSKSTYSAALADTVQYEVLVPKTMALSPKATYPLIIVFDRQNSIGYSHTLHTLDYLTANTAMPNAIIIGISLNGQQRNRWTLPGTKSNAKADAFLDFILQDLPQANKQLPINDFLLLIGHSRTAIFASYALSKRPDKINAIFGASLAFFDFGQQAQQQLFEAALTKIKSSKRPTYYYYSVGGKANRDAHEEEVLKLTAYLEKKNLPANFHWKFYHAKTANHFTNYGLTVGDALHDLFLPYRESLNETFTLLNSLPALEQVPWEAISKIYIAKSTQLGLPLQPDLVFYNSVASHFGYASNVKAESRIQLAQDVLQKAAAAYPQAESFASWTANLYLEQGNKVKALQHYKLALGLIEKNSYLSAEEKRALQNSTKKHIQEIEKSW